MPWTMDLNIQILRFQVQLLYQDSGGDTRADEANHFFERLDAQGQHLQENEVTDMYVLVDKLAFNIERYL